MVWLSSTSTRLRFVSSATPSSGPPTGSRGPTALRIPTPLLVLQHRFYRRLGSWWCASSSASQAEQQQQQWLALWTPAVEQTLVARQRWQQLRSEHGLFNLRQQTHVSQHHSSLFDWAETTAISVQNDVHMRSMPHLLQAEHICIIAPDLLQDAWPPAAPDKLLCRCIAVKARRRILVGLHKQVSGHTWRSMHAMISVTHRVGKSQATFQEHMHS
jgi:hypothetical protein